MRFIDSLRIHLSSGKGGPGCASFVKEAYRPRGGPDGGDGGVGGNVIFQVNTQLNSLIHLQGKRSLSAKNGMPGAGSKCSGANGMDMVIEVPPGTVIKDIDGQVLLDMTEGEQVFLQGGRGGKGNHFFKTSVNQAPTHFQPGEPGEEKLVTLELRLIADVGVIGFPNAGKSTLVSSITSAKPKIADYPFTTLNPQLGVVKVDTEASFTIADIPGLIEGAAEGVGLGHQFLQHIERTRVFVHLLDISDFSQRDVFDDYQKINLELKKYDAGKPRDEGEIPLAERQQIVVFNKYDAASEERVLDLEAQFAKAGVEIIKISAVARKNLDQLISALSAILLENNNG